MMGRLNQDQGRLFYSFCLDDAVPSDHRVRDIAAVLDLSWVHGELAPSYSMIGRPSIDPVLTLRMLILGHVFAIRSERALCREVQVNLAYRWFCEARRHVARTIEKAPFLTLSSLSRRSWYADSVDREHLLEGLRNARLAA
jgi:Transposase domain (DUF772)